MCDFGLGGEDKEGGKVGWGCTLLLMVFIFYPFVWWVGGDGYGWHFIRTSYCLGIVLLVHKVSIFW
jgi:hypothetical protein